MAKARMLHKSISTSSQVSRLSLPAQLLFTWMIPHTDVEGKLKGDPKYVRATVVPMLNWSTNKVNKCIEEIATQGLIYYWQVDNEWIIEFVNFERYQTVRIDHEKASYLPSFHNRNDSLSTNQRQSEDVTKSTQSNISESNSEEINKSENIADKNLRSLKEELPQIVNPRTFVPSSDAENMAFIFWEEFEPKNPLAFTTTYLYAARKKIPVDVMFRFASEIRQDRSVKNKGALYKEKVNQFLKERKDYEDKQKGGQK